MDNDGNKESHMIKFRKNTDKLKIIENFINMEEIQNEVIINLNIVIVE